MKVFALGALFAAGVSAGPAAAEELVTSLSTHRVLIGSNYTGAQIAVFGSVEREGRSVARAEPYDIVVTVTGPRRRLLVREKERLGPIWLNSEQRRFWDAPSFFAVHTTRPVAEMMNAEDARRLQIGLANRLTPAGVGQAFDGPESRFTEALIRLKGADRLYTQVERGVTFMTPSLFRAAIVLPATAPTGNYDVSVELFAGPLVLARQQTSFEVVQIGFEEQLALVARQASLAYGVFVVLFALLAGWLATVIFRRD
jgi:uncharacterized protein (TIGR02186 family)